MTEEMKADWRSFAPDTFDRFCAQANVTPAERDALAWHLAMFRCRKTYEALK